MHSENAKEKISNSKICMLTNAGNNISKTVRGVVISLCIFSLISALILSKRFEIPRFIEYIILFFFNNLK